MKQLLIACSLGLAASAWAQNAPSPTAPAASSAPAVLVQDAWVRATVAGQSATGAFMTLTAPQATRLVEVRSPLAGVAEVHEMKLDGDVMRMRAVPVLALPAGQAVALKPGGFHLMLMNLRAPAKAGERVPLTLVFEGADGQRRTQELSATVRALTASAPAAAPGGHGSGHKH